MEIKKALYPGSFDPITKGHMSVIEQATQVFDEVIIGVLTNSAKTNKVFTTEERVNVIKEIYKDNPKIKVISSEGASADIAIENNCKMIVRGLRNLSDYNYEMELSQVNKYISGNVVNTICFFADEKYQTTSSTIVREIFRLGKDISKYVDKRVIEKMKNKQRKGEKE